MQKFNLEERLINFSVEVLTLAEKLPNNQIGKYFQSQLSRSSVAASLNYGEAQAGESRKDFIHKLKISLKELRETMVCLKIIQKKNYISSEKLPILLKETNELISIFVKSCQTAKTNLEKAKK